eukprot:11045231-Karenia_brevis.AAC.1
MSGRANLPSHNALIRHLHACTPSSPLTFSSSGGKDESLGNGVGTCLYLSTPVNSVYSFKQSSQ